METIWSLLSFFSIVEYDVLWVLYRSRVLLFARYVNSIMSLYRTLPLTTVGRISNTKIFCFAIKAFNIASNTTSFHDKS